MSHSFSISYVKEMEGYLDANIKILRSKIYDFAANDQTFDLKKALHFYVIDTLGELAFSQSFGIQVSDDESRVPPVIEHSLLAAVTGAWPMMTARLKRWLPVVPHKGLRALFEGRKACADLATRCVTVRLNALRNSSRSKTSAPERKDILTSLINAKHPDTGKHLTQTDLETEAFGFMWVSPLRNSYNRIVRLGRD
jgi:cytochrome P450